MIAEIIADALLTGFVIGDRIIWTPSGDFENDKRKRFGTIIDVHVGKNGMKFPVIKFDDEYRQDMMRQITHRNSVKIINR